LTGNRSQRSSKLKGPTFSHVIYNEYYNSEHVRVGGGNYLLKISDILDFDRTATRTSHIPNFLYKLSYDFYLI
jgi:hypothetical protein